MLRNVDFPTLEPNLRTLQQHNKEIFQEYVDKF